MMGEIALTDGVPEQPAAAIRWHEQAADLLSERADEHRWEAARLISEELETGKSQRQLASEIGKSQPHVWRMNQCWKRYFKVSEPPSFNEIYNSDEIRGVKPPEPEPPELDQSDDPEPEPEPEGDEEDDPYGELAAQEFADWKREHGDQDDGEPGPAPERPKPTRIMRTLYTHDGRPFQYPGPQSKATFNETTGEGISWAAWSWNPVTGCLHGCTYCYARAIIHRYPEANPAGFTPLFHEERLDAPANTRIPIEHRDDPAYRRVFVCSMADLYGRWVPDEWIKQIHESMLASPHWEYLLLTKFPDRYVGLDMPPGTWLGTSVDEQKRVRIAERAFRQVEDVKVKWLSLEPLTEPLEFSDLSMFDWVVIGAQTATNQPDGYEPAFAPDWPWWFRIALQAHEAGCKVHIKPNLWNGKPGQLPNEYPEV